MTDSLLNDGLLQVRDIVVGHPAAPRLGPVSFDLAPGEALTILGPNGAGKSTLLRAIMGLERLESGAISIGGKPPARMAPREMARHGLGYVPEGRRPFPGLTVEENLLTVSDAGRRARTQRVDEIFNLFPQLVRRRRVEAWRLSGGEQQMLVIGRALMRQPRILLLDEPSLGLAPKTRADLFEVIRTIHADGVAVLLAEQAVGQALMLADNAIFLANGRAVTAGPAASYTDYDALAARYLG